MQKIEAIGAVAADDDVWMTAVGAVFRSFARRGEKVARLHRPVKRILGPVDAEPFPDIDHHPVMTLPTKDVGALARPLAHAGDLAAVFPSIEIRAISEVDRFVVPFVVVPEAPSAVGQPVHTGIDHPVAREF